MVAISGRNGSVKIGTNVIADLSEWTLEVTNDTEEVPVFGGNGWKQKMYTMSSWTATASGKWNMNDTAGQLALQNSIMTNPTAVTLDLCIDDTHKYNGSAFIKSMSVKTQAAGTVDVEFQFDGNGALTYT